MLLELGDSISTGFVQIPGYVALIDINGKDDICARSVCNLE